MGPFPVSIKVWATICDPTLNFNLSKIKKKKLKLYLTFCIKFKEYSAVIIYKTKTYPIFEKVSFRTSQDLKIGGAVVTVGSIAS